VLNIMAERTRTAPERQRTRAPSGRAPPGCDVSELFALLGQPHMLRILAQLNDSGSRSLRFTELQLRLQMSPKTLSLRLHTLVEGGFVTRHAFREIPPRVEYQPTPKLVQLSSLFDLLRVWATENTMHATPMVSVIGRHPGRGSAVNG
jgi:DNA-binding HxlR family transcriptional regulator